MNLLEIRKAGIGSNFTVSDSEDGYRQDNTVWFGTCATCGERVVSSLMNSNRGWVHSVITDITYHDSGNILSFKSSTIDYCPKG